jgi:TP901 family phage tail tape measure protein
VSGSSIVKQIAMTIVADAGTAKDTLADVSAKADELAKPKTLTIGADTGEATAEVTDVTEALARYEEAAAEAADASMRLAEVQADDKASAAELSAAMNANADASLRALDAQIRLGEAELEAAARAKESADAQEESAGKTDAAGAAASDAHGKLGLLALGIGAVGVASVDMGMKFEDGATQLVTGAGQSAAGLKQVEAGMLALSTQTATSSSDIESGMYLVESAGYHGAAGLQVLKAAAEGAKVGGADLSTVANAVTSALNAYHQPASAAVAVTNELVETVASGKMHMQDLAGSLANVLPIAASAHISLAQVGGAMATMTSQGMSAQRASMDLANLIRSLVSPSATASSEMKALGLNANEVSKNIGKEGLTGTLQELSDAILRNTHGGNVLLGDMKDMTPAARELSEQILAGSISSGNLTSALKGLNPEQAELVTKFKASATSATGLKQTYDAAMKTMTGGATGLNVALLLGGQHMKTFEQNTDAVGKAAKGAGKDVHGWGDVTHDTSFKLDQAKTAVKNMGTEVGVALLPAVSKILTPLSEFAEHIADSKGEVDALAGVMAGSLAAYAAVKAVNAFKSVKSAVTDVYNGFSSLVSKITGSQGALDAQAGETQALAAAEQEQAAAAQEAADAQTELDVAEDANPVGGIMIAIAGLVAIIALVVTHWKDFERWGKEAFHAVAEAAEDAFGWVKSHWQLILAILTGPIGLAVLFIKDHWKDIEHGAEDAFHVVEHAVDTAIGWIKGHWPLLLAILTGPIGLAVYEIKEHWQQIVTGAETAIHDVGSWFGRFPGMILSWVSGFGHLLYQAGSDLLHGLEHGIEDAVGDVLGAVEGVGKTILGGLKDVLGIFSPSTEGRAIGRYFTQGVALGITDELSMATAASQRVAAATIGGFGSGAIRPGGASAGGAAGGGNTTINLTVHGFVGNESQIATEITRVLNVHARRNGNISPLSGVRPR